MDDTHGPFVMPVEISISVNARCSAWPVIGAVTLSNVTLPDDA